MEPNTDTDSIYSDCCCPSYITASASADGSAFTTTGDLVTSTATATGIGSSYTEAYTIALYQAQQNANITAQYDANIISQTISIVDGLYFSPLQTFYVTNLNDSGEGSFRSCLINANNTNNSQILFNLSGTIKIQSNLPNVTAQVKIVGTSAPNYKKNNTPVVIIDFNNNNGLVLSINSNNCYISGITFKNSNYNGITVISSYNKIINCVITNNNGNGIYLSPNSNNNIIGDYKHSNTGKKLPSNIINLNGLNGILFDNSSYNLTNNNYIGTDFYGKKAKPNGNNGILVGNNSNNNNFGTPVYTDSNGKQNNPTGTKGTVTPVYVIPPYGNLISGNTMNGVSVYASNNNSFYGNFIGTNYKGNSDIGNEENGILLSFTTNTNLIGCTFINDPFVYYNVISGNNKNGIYCIFSINTVIQGNFFGIGANNKCLIPNNEDGIKIGIDCTNTTIGGVIPLGNVVSGNNRNGIYLTDNSQGVISFNTFCGVYAFGGAAPNKQNGILIDTYSSGHTIGSSTTFNGLRTNVVSGNDGNGILIAGYSNNITIEAIICGTNTEGNVAIPNKKNGICISENTYKNTIGNNFRSVIVKSVISGNGENGILITDNSRDTIITNCNIGSNVGEDIMIPNGKNGISIELLAKGNVIDVFNGKHNVICNSGEYGVFLGPLVEDNVVSHNFIGINEALQSMPNGSGNVNPSGSYPASNIVVDNYETPIP